MSDYVFVEYGDLGGGGFIPSVAEGRPEPPAAFTAAATRLVQNNVPQPPEPADDGNLYPLWSLRGVDLEGERYWCFAVQGRGGAFGQAGMCQFLFVPGATHPCDLWHHAVALVRPDGRLAHPEAEEKSGHWGRPGDEGRVRAGLAGLFAGEKKVVLDGEPLDVAATVGAMLAVVPTAVAREHVWSTCLVRRPTQDNRSIVTGYWPDALPGGNAGLRSWLERPAGRGAPVSHARAEQVVDWLAHRSAGGSRLPDHLAALPDLAELTADLARTELGFDLADVGGMLAAHDERLLTGRGLALLATWVGDNPVQAVRHLVEPLPTAHEHVVFDALLDEHVRVGRGNPALFPPAADAVPGWSGKLVRLMRERFAHADLVDFVRDHVIAAGRPLHGADAHLAHESWLTSLGVSPNDPTVGIYGVPTGSIAAELEQAGVLSATGKQFLLASADPVGEAKRVVDRCASLPPSAVASLVGLFDDAAGITAVLEHALRQEVSVNGPAWAEQWLAEVHELVGAGRAPVVLSSALGFFRREDREPPRPLLVLGLRAEANRLDPSSTGYWVMTRAAALIESEPTRRAARSATTWPAAAPASQSAGQPPTALVPVHGAPRPGAQRGKKSRRSRKPFRFGQNAGGAHTAPTAERSGVDGPGTGARPATSADAAPRHADVLTGTGSPAPQANPDPGARDVERGRRAFLPGLSAHWPLILRAAGVLIAGFLLVGLFFTVSYMMHR